MASARSLRLWLSLRIALAGILPLLLAGALVVGVVLPQLRADLEIRHEALAHAIVGRIETQLLIGEIALDRLSGFLDRSPAATGLLTMVLDRQGQIIAHSQAAPSAQKQALGHLPIVRDALQGKPVPRDFELNGETYVGTPVRVPQLGWIVLVAQPRVEALRPVLTTLWVLAVSALVAFMLALALALGLARGLARRISRYGDQAHAITEGDYNQPWPVSRIREFDGLGRALERMSLAMQESEARFRSAIDSVPFDFFLISPNGRYLLQNAACIRSWGDVVGKRPEDVANDAATLAHWKDNNRRAFAGEIVEEEVRFVVHDEERWLHNIIAPIKDRDEIKGIVGLNIDITERKRAERALQQSETKYRRLHESMRDAFVSVDLAGTVQEYNPVYRAMLGYSEEELRLMTYQDLTPDKWHAIEADIVEKQVLTRGYSDVYEKEYRRRDGSVFPVELRTFLIRDANDQPASMWAIVRDISERKQAEEALRHRNRQLRMISDGNLALIRITDEMELLATVCTIAVQEGGYRMAWVAYAECDAPRSVRPVAHAGFEDGYLHSTGISSADEERGLISTSICSGRPCVAQNIASDSRFASRRAEAAKRGYASMCALPLTAGDRTFGALGIYASTPDAFDSEEIRLLSELASDLAFGITALRTRIEHERANVALRESEFFLRRSQEVGDLGSYYFDARTGSWISSEKLDQIFGIDSAFQKTTSGWMELVHPDDREEMLEHMTEHVLAKHHRFDKEYRILRRNDGLERWVHGLGELEFDDSGVPIKMIGTIQDITRSKRADRALQENEQLLRQVVRVSQLGIFEHDHLANLIYWSPEQRKIHGWNADEPVTLRAFLASVHPDDQARIAAAVERAHDPAGDGSYDVEHRIIRRGEIRWIVTRSQTFFAGEGTARHAVRTVGADLDMTERKRAEAELQRHREHLEELVGERTADLRRAMSQLVQAEKLAGLGSLVAGVAHELNTPLGNARVVASSLGDHLREFRTTIESGALRRSQLDAFMSRSCEAVDLLERNAARAADLISHFKQLAVDQTSMRRRPFNFCQTVDEVLVTLQPQFKLTAHRIEREIPPDLELDSYPGPLEQIIANLISNSLTHGFDGVAAGVIRIRAESLGAGRIQIEYTDNGVGIPEAIVKRVFEPFFTTRLGRGGSGLGLYIVYNLVTGLLGGTIEVHSALGHGVRFVIALPQVAPDQPSLGTPA